MESSARSGVRWSSLEALGGSDGHPFLTAPWLSSWVGHFHSRDRVDLVTSDTAGGGGFPLATWPTSTVGLPSRGLVSAESADLAPLAVGPGALQRTVEDLFASVPRVGALLVGRLDTSSATTKALLRVAEERGVQATALGTEEHPYLELDHLGDSGLHRLASRNKVLRRERKLAARGELDYVESAVPDSRDGLPAFFDMLDRRWAGMGRPISGLFGTSRGRAMISDAARGWYSDGQLRLGVVQLDGVPVASRLGVQIGARYFGIRSTFDPDFSEYGLGHLVTYYAMRECLASGVETFEFMRGAGDHKSAWTDTSHEVGLYILSCGVPRSAAPLLGRAMLKRRLRERLAGDRR